jgi:hypothetical protein
VQSDNCRDEARRANERNILCPAIIAQCSIPLGLGVVQTADLRTWPGDRAHSQWRLLVDRGVARKLGRSGRPPAPAAAAPLSAPRRTSSHMRRWLSPATPG